MFVAINFIHCEEHYRARFEELFATRAHAIDSMPGFRSMNVLKPSAGNEDYLIVSYWDSEESFSAWTGSPEFLAGHKRGFEDMRRAKAEGQAPPMLSTFRTYSVLAE